MFVVLLFKAVIKIIISYNKGENGKFSGGFLVKTFVFVTNRPLG